MALDKSGIYKGRATKRADGSWAQYGESSGGNLELILDFHIQIDGVPQRRSIVLYFSTASREFSVERLRACGWKGTNIADLTGVDGNDVDIEIRHEEDEGKTRNKYEIMTGGGRFSTKNPIDPKMFAAKFDAMGGSGQGGGSSGGAPPPPF